MFGRVLYKLSEKGVNNSRTSNTTLDNSTVHGNVTNTTHHGDHQVNEVHGDQVTVQITINKNIITNINDLAKHVGGNTTDIDMYDEEFGKLVKTTRDTEDLDPSTISDLPIPETMIPEKKK